MKEIFDIALDFSGLFALNVEADMGKTTSCGFLLDKGNNNQKCTTHPNTVRVNGHISYYLKIKNSS